jgi:hypothetical protein
MILCVEKVEVKIGELLKIARAVVQNVIEIPDLEAVAHADEQDVACFAASLVEPGRDRQPAVTVDAGRGGETELAASVRLPMTVSHAKRSIRSLSTTLSNTIRQLRWSCRPTCTSSRAPRAVTVLKNGSGSMMTPPLPTSQIALPTNSRFTFGPPGC